MTHFTFTFTEKFGEFKGTNNVSEPAVPAADEEEGLSKKEKAKRKKVSTLMMEHWLLVLTVWIYTVRKRRRTRSARRSRSGQ